MDRKKEINEAINACDKALVTVSKALSKLDTAKGFGFFDLLGGGLFTSLMKHNNINEAEAMLEELEEDLKDLEGELSDIHMTLKNYDMPSSLSRNLDIFFDNIFSDWNTQQSINDNIDLLNKLNSILASLKNILLDELKGLG